MIHARLRVVLMADIPGEPAQIELATSEDPVLCAKVFDAMVQEHLKMEERAKEQDQ